MNWRRIVDVLAGSEVPVYVMTTSANILADYCPHCGVADHRLDEAWEEPLWRWRERRARHKMVCDIAKQGELW